MKMISVNNAENELIKYLRYISPTDIFEIALFLSDGLTASLGQSDFKAMKLIKDKENLKVRYFEATKVFQNKLMDVWQESELKLVD